MNAQDQPKIIAALKLIATATLWAIIWIPLRGEWYEPILQHRFTKSTAFVLWIVIVLVTSAIVEIGFIYWLIRREKAASFRKFIKIERLDIQGIWLTVGLGFGIQLVNVALLQRYIFEPAKNFLLKLGFPGPQIGLGTSELVPELSTTQAVFLTFLLLAFWWSEIPEELFFRGYFQNQIQEITGKNVAIIFSALFWALAHLWGLANTLERFVLGLVYAIAFRLRQNTSGPMIAHPVGNRALMLSFVIPQIFGQSPDLGGRVTWLIIVGLNIVLLLLVIRGWGALKLDRS